MLGGTRIAGHVASGWPVEYAPHKQVVARILESVLGCGGHEKQVAHLESLPLAIVKQNAPPANHEVDLVLFVRCLLVGASGRPEYYVKGATMQNADGSLAAARETRLSLREMNHMTPTGRAHPLPVVRPNGQAPLQRHVGPHLIQAPARYAQARSCPSRLPSREARAPVLPRQEGIAAR